jgi:hypothetical protein
MIGWEEHGKHREYLGCGSLIALIVLERIQALGIVETSADHSASAG